MSNNIENKLSQMFSGVDNGKLKNSIEAVSKLLSTEAGQKLKNSLSEKDKKTIIEKFMKMDSKEVSEKLKNADLSQIGNMSAEDIMRRLK